MEGLLVDLKPDSWLYRDVRQHIEDVYLRTDDYAGLSAYYEEWLENNPDDVDAMTRWARRSPPRDALPKPVNGTDEPSSARTVRDRPQAGVH